jgi:hypothetical protein
MVLPGTEQLENRQRASLITVAKRKSIKKKIIVSLNKRKWRQNLL